MGCKKNIANDPAKTVQIGIAIITAATIKRVPVILSTGMQAAKFGTTGQGIKVGGILKSDAKQDLALFPLRKDRVINGKNNTLAFEVTKNLRRKVLLLMKLLRSLLMELEVLICNS